MLISSPLRNKVQSINQSTNLKSQNSLTSLSPPSQELDESFETLPVQFFKAYGPDSFIHFENSLVYIHCSQELYHHTVYATFFSGLLYSTAFHSLTQSLSSFTFILTLISVWLEIIYIIYIVYKLHGPFSQEHDKRFHGTHLTDSQWVSLTRTTKSTQQVSWGISQSPVRKNEEFREMKNCT